MVGIVRVEVLCQRQRGEAESLATQCLLQGLEVLRVDPLGTEEGIDFGRNRGYERCAPTTLATSLAVASARRRTVCKRVSKSCAFTLARLSFPPGRAGLRIPVKPITRSGGKPITCSGANRSPVPTQTDHLSERSDAGRRYCQMLWIGSLT